MLSKVIKAFRLVNNYTVKDVSDLTGLSSIYIGELERGIKKNASDDTLFKLSNGFNISLCFLFELIKYSDIIEKNYDKLNENDYSESHRDRIILQFLSYKILDYYFVHKMEYNAAYELLVKNYGGFTYSKKIN